MKYYVIYCFGREAAIPAYRWDAQQEELGTPEQWANGTSAYLGTIHADTDQECREKAKALAASK